jgi:hypothetical protein
LELKAEAAGILIRGRARQSFARRSSKQIKAPSPKPVGYFNDFLTREASWSAPGLRRFRLEPRTTRNARTASGKKFFRVLGVFRGCCFCPAAKIILGWTTGTNGFNAKTPRCKSAESPSCRLDHGEVIAHYARGVIQARLHVAGGGDLNSALPFAARAGNLFDSDVGA